MNLQEFKKQIENIKISYDYDYEEIYSSLYNICIDYMNDTQDFDFEYLFNEIIDYELAEERAK